MIIWDAGVVVSSVVVDETASQIDIQTVDFLEIMRYFVANATHEHERVSSRPFAPARSRLAGDSLAGAEQRRRRDTHA